MKRRLLKSSAFIRSAKKVVKRDRHVAQAIRDTLEQLADDAFRPSLKLINSKGILPIHGHVASNMI